jgi:phosphoribosylformylglycinamidine synthase
MPLAAIAIAQLFAEEPGAVLQVAVAQLRGGAGLPAATAWPAACSRSARRSRMRVQDPLRRSQSSMSRGSDLRRAWSETSIRCAGCAMIRSAPRRSTRLPMRRSGPALATELRSAAGHRGADDCDAARPRVAVLREQGVNSQVEMAAVLDRAGFESHDLHMSDLLGGERDARGVSGLIACGGFSYGDVLGAGGGWARSILFHERTRREQFQRFFARTDTFSLGVCNGCQMLAVLKELIPGASTGRASCATAASSSRRA